MNGQVTPRLPLEGGLDDVAGYAETTLELANAQLGLTHREQVQIPKLGSGGQGLHGVIIRRAPARQGAVLALVGVLSRLRLVILAKRQITVTTGMFWTGRSASLAVLYVFGDFLTCVRPSVEPSEVSLFLRPTAWASASLSGTRWCRQTLVGLWGRPQLTPLSTANVGPPRPNLAPLSASAVLGRRWCNGRTKRLTSSQRC